MRLHFCAFITLLSVALSIVGCGGSSSSADGAGNADAGSPSRVKLQGSGASFPAPIYMKWFQDFSKKTAGVTVDYQSKGSGAGIKDLINETVDFAASDAAMSAEELSQVARGAIMLPMTAGEVVLAYNLPNGPTELKLSRDVYSKILMGEITKWNDPAVVACNDGFAMPDSDITVVVRSDSSGTTHVFSSHLSAVSATWKEKYGINKTINWPDSDKFVKGPKNDGVMALIKQTPGSIGYVEYGFAKQTKQPMAVLENKAGKFVAPSADSGLAALASTSDIPDDLVLWLPDPAGEQSYPIVSYTWLLAYKKYDDTAKSAALKNLIEYCLTDGQKDADSLGYLPLPQNMIERVQQAIGTIE